MTLYPRATEMTLPQWRQLLAGPDLRVADGFGRIYGDDEERQAERLSLFRRVVEGAAERLPSDLPSLLVRVPGRINTMGLHSDGQYSFKNHLVFDREMVAVVQRRQDDVVSLASPRDEYRDFALSISDALPRDRRGTDWLSLCESADIEVGGWQNYLVGPVLALQNHLADQPLRGMNVFLDGDIPVAAGVSSSSALTTLAGIAALCLNEIDLPWSEAIRTLGAGEWYSGTRGGPGDTAAQMLCRRGRLLHVKYDLAFDPYEEHHLPLPDDWRIVLCDTQVKSRKAVGARDSATSRGLAQAAGMVILRDRFPAALGSIECLAHLTPDSLPIRLSEVYQMLKALPERATMRDLAEAAPERGEELDAILRHFRVDLPEFPVRQVCLYMVCEAARGARNRVAVETQDESELNRLMSAAHDGDRVVRRLDDGRREPYDNRATDELLDRLSRMADSADAAEREAAELPRQPGGFGCSCPELDLLVDLCDSLDGVIGARITGAGLGGCMFAYVHEAAVGEVLRQVNQRYYEPRGLRLSAWEVAPIDGAGPLVLEGE